MKKFEGMLFCTDIDGTLYNDKGTISKQNLDAIEYFKSEGGLFTFITGRPPFVTESILENIKPNAPFGCLNGGGIYDAKSDKYLWNVSLSDDAIELVREVDKQLPEMGIFYSTKERIYFNKDNSAMEILRERTGLPNIYRHYEDVKETVLKIVFAHEDEDQVLSLSKLLNNHTKANNFDFIRSEKNLYEILPKDVSKGKVLLKMAELLDIKAENTIAVGDYNNDISMIKAAGVGFAVANAVDELKQVADYVTVSNNEHAISVIIDGLDKGIFKPKLHI